jgi:hypothetical protein
VSDRPFDFESGSPDAEADDFQRSYRTMRVVYVAAIGLATIGWLWLMAWLSMYLFDAT